jgi:O-antigen/teichoic acid export membrane protein
VIRAHERSLTIGGVSLHGLRARLVRGVGWNLVATVFTQGSSFLLNLLLANFWGLRLFGQFAMMQTTITALTAGAQAIVATTATRYAAELRADDPTRAGRVLGLCGVATLGIAAVAGGGMMIFAGPIAVGALREPALGPVLTLVGVVVMFTIVSGFLSGAIAGLEGYPALGKAGMLTGSLYVLVGVVGGRMGGLSGAVLGLATSAAIQCAVLAYALSREAAAHGVPITARGADGEVAVLARFLAPSAINSVVAYSALWGANALLVRHADGYQQMALFSAANSLRILVLFVPAIVNNVTLSLLNNQRGADERSRYTRVFWTNLGITTALVAAGALGVMALGPQLLAVFGKEFRAGYPVLLILMFSTLPETMVASAIQIAQSRERMWLWCVSVVVPCYGALIGLAALLTGPYGARGLAWSYTGAMSVALVVALVVVWRLGIWGDRPSGAGRAGRD